MKRIARMVSSSTEDAYDFGVSAQNAAHSLNACFAHNTGLSGRVSADRDEADIYLRADVNHAVQILFNRSCLQKMVGRVELQDLCGIALIANRDSEAMLQTGKDRVQVYVSGGFLAGHAPAFPKHVCMSESEVTFSARDADTDDGLLGMESEETADDVL